MYKKAWCTCKVVVLIIKPIAFLTSSLSSPSSDLKVPYGCKRERVSCAHNFQAPATQPMPKTILWLLVLRFYGLWLADKCLALFLDNQNKTKTNRELKLTRSSFLLVSKVANVTGYSNESWCLLLIWFRGTFEHSCKKRVSYLAPRHTKDWNWRRRRRRLRRRRTWWALREIFTRLQCYKIIQI